MPEGKQRQYPPAEKLFPLHNPHTYQGRLSDAVDVGVDFGENDEIRRRMVVAAASAIAGYSGVDHLLRGRFKDFEQTDPYPDRIDVQLEENLQWVFHDTVSSIQGRPNTEIDSDCLGHFLSDATLVRLRYTLRRCIAEANIGALFECAAILRLGLEIFSWSSEIREWNDAKKIKKQSASKSVTFVKRSIPEWGILYGLLSKYGHWEHSAHVNMLRKEKPDQREDVVLASVKFKIAALLLVSVFVVLCSRMAPHLPHFVGRTDSELKDRLGQIESTLVTGCRCVVDQFPELVILVIEVFQNEKEP